MTVQFYIESFLAGFDDDAGNHAATGDHQLTFQWCRSANDDELYGLLARIAQRGDFTPSQDARLSALFRALSERDWAADSAAPQRLPSWLMGLIAQFYQQLGPRSHARGYLLQLVASHGDAELAALAEWLTTDPPRDIPSILLAFAPLFRRRDYDARHLFPRLLNAIEQPSIAAPVVDLANYLKREGLVAEHPAAQRLTQLVGLLGELNHRLACLEEGPGSAERPASVSHAIDESVALAISLCDALALIGDDAAIGKLFQTLELRHRRLRTEAAAALATLGQPAGIQALVALAAEPVVRLRVLAYAEELDCFDLIDEQYQTSEARAEAELALWLSQPAQVGFPPTSLELVDTRTQYWPGFEQELSCFLFRFSYQLPAGSFSNIGIAGPLVHAFAADIADLSLDDIYAAFAGWQAEHEDIYEVDVTELTEAQRVDVARLERRLRDEGYSNVRPLRIGFFFGERSLVARAHREHVEGIAVVDAETVQWHSTAHRARPLGADELFSIYKGRKLLRSFN